MLPLTPMGSARSVFRERTFEVSPQLIRIIVAILFLGHGLGHALPALPVMGFRLSASHSSDSWILNRVMGAGTASSGPSWWMRLPSPPFSGLVGPRGCSMTDGEARPGRQGEG